MTRSSIRFRLTVWYAGVALVSVAIVSVSVYIFVRNRLEAASRGRLDAGFSTVETVIRNSDGDLAITYTRAGGHIEVTVSAGGGEVMIDITDDGPGIPVEAREKVFERFYRMNGARSRSDGGVRLGLSIARWSVEANGGRIAFLDCEEGGSCCRIALPMSRTPSG